MCVSGCVVCAYVKVLYELFLLLLFAEDRGHLLPQVTQEVAVRLHKQEGGGCRE